MSAEVPRQDAEKAQKCIGLWGRIFGHRFNVPVGEYAYKTDFCGRCGLRPWSPRLPAEVDR